MKFVSVILCISLVLGCAGAFAEGSSPNKVTDNAPPELTNFVFAENGANLQAGSVVHVSVQAEDRSKIRSVRVSFVNDDAESGDDSFGFSLKYNAASDRYEGEYTLDSGLANGEWRINSIESTDEYYNSCGMGGTDYGTFNLVGNTNPGPNPGLFVSASIKEQGQYVRPGDTIHVSVKLSGAADSVYYDLTRRTDDGSAGMGYGSECSYNEATGLWEGEFTFWNDMANGAYYMTMVETYANKQWSYVYEEAIGEVFVNFTGGSDDATGPFIAGITFTENTATLGPGQEVHVTATIADAGGVNWAYVSFQGPYASSMDGKKWSWAEYRKNHTWASVGSGFDIELKQQSGDTWTGSFQLPEDYVNAQYTLSYISAYDKAGNETYISYDNNEYYFNFVGPDIVNDNIGDFVKRCYNIILGRGVDETGLQGWGLALSTGQSTAAQIINSLTESDEFKLKGLSNEQIVEIMYRTMLDREADAAGKQAWVDVLNQGYPVSAVVNGFSRSIEFRGICKKYGIKPGTVDAGQPTQPVAPAADMGKIKAFVSRCYEIILGRGADPDGLNGWANALASGQAQASQIIDGFVNSPEFLNKGLSKGEQVDTLYKAMLGRGADPDGKAAWVKVLEDGNPFAVVINGFCGSIEFGNICAEYGIQPGSVQVKAALVKRVSITPEGSDPAAAVVRAGYDSEYTNQEKVRAFVEHCYDSVLGRQGDEDGILSYTALIMGGKKTPKQVAYEFVFSPEFQGKLPGNEAFIRILYRLYLNREPNAEELAGWVAMLEGGTSLDEIMKGFAESAEFRAIVKEMKE